MDKITTAVIAIFCLGLTGCYEPIYHTQVNRKPGEPIDGVWYDSVEGGCYDDGIVIKFDKKVGWFYSGDFFGKVYNIRHKKWNGSQLNMSAIVYLFYNNKEYKDLSYIINDTGKKLIFEKYKKLGEGYKSYNNPLILVRCGQYSFVEWLKTSIGIKKLWRGFTEQDPKWRQPTAEEIKAAVE